MNKKYKNDLKKLIKLAELMIKDFQILLNEIDCNEEEVNKFVMKRGITELHINYQSFYSEAISILELLLPTRLEEFKSYYLSKARKHTQNNDPNYRIQNFLVGYINSHYDINMTYSCINMQYEILKSVEKTFNSTLFNLIEIESNKLFTSELESAKHLLKKKFIRASGAVAGVVLENHLLKISNKYNIKIDKTDPSISYLNDHLKKNKIISPIRWRKIQVLCDIRNLCDHSKTEDPTKEDVNSLINGTSEILKNVK